MIMIMIEIINFENKQKSFRRADWDDDGWMAWPTQHNNDICQVKLSNWTKEE